MSMFQAFQAGTGMHATISLIQMHCFSFQLHVSELYFLSRRVEVFFPYMAEVTVIQFWHVS